MKKDGIQTRNRKMSTKSKKSRKYSHESDYSKAMMSMSDMKYGSFSPPSMAQVAPLMSSGQHSLSPYGSHYPAGTFGNGFQTNSMSPYGGYTTAAWNTSVARDASFPGLSTSMVGAIA